MIQVLALTGLALFLMGFGIGYAVATNRAWRKGL